MKQSGDSYWVVVTRDRHLPIERCMTLEEAGRRIVRDKAFGMWTVLHQGKGASMRELTIAEKKRLEKVLFPTLFEGG